MVPSGNRQSSPATFFFPRLALCKIACVCVCDVLISDENKLVRCSLCGSHGLDKHRKFRSLFIVYMYMLHTCTHNYMCACVLILRVQFTHVTYLSKRIKQQQCYVHQPARLRPYVLEPKPIKLEYFLGEQPGTRLCS